MQILNRSIKLTGTEKSDIVIGAKVSDRLVFVIENRGPGNIDLVDLGPVEANRFIVVGGMDSIKIEPPKQFSVVDVTVFTA